MDISKLELFFAAANSGSFTQAAEKCNVAQTTMSKYIAQLESELGVKLFYRTTRECSLTEAGHTFYNGAKDLRRDYEDLQRQLLNVAENELKIGLYGEFFDLSVLSRFSESHPEIALRVSFGSRAELYEQLKKRKIHAVLIPNILVSHALGDHSLNSINILSGDPFLYCSKASLKEHGTIQNVIKSLPLITKSKEPRYHDYCRSIMERCFGACFESITVVESRAKQHLLTELSQGFTIMLEQEARGARGLCAYSLEDSFDETLQLYYSVKHVPDSLQKFISFINSEADEQAK